MLSPWHKSDYPRLSNEEKVLDALRPLDIPPGTGMMPRPSSREEVLSPRIAEKMKKGPVVLLLSLAKRPHRDGNDLHHVVSDSAVVGLSLRMSRGARCLSGHGPARFPVCGSYSIPRLLSSTLANVDLV